MNAVLQPELPLANETPPDESVDLLIAVLDQSTGWLNAEELCVKLGSKPTDTNKRKIRNLANASTGKIISGQKGYKHIRHATPEEITHAANWLRHQAKEMDDRAAQILRQYHSLPHTPK